MARKNDKRIRLVSAADKLFHEQGVSTTTLANIAQLAEVPLGNVYYYFKSKDSIVISVIDYRRKLIQQQAEELDAISDVRQRLQSFVSKSAGHSEQTASFGDVLGSLCQELGKHGGELAAASAELLQDIIKWCEKQFSALGKGEQSRSLALMLVSSLQGMNLLTLTFKNEEATQAQVAYLENWVATV